MIQIETFFKNHFDTDRLTDDRLKAFSEDHLNKLTAWLTVHTDAALSALLADMALKHNAYFGAITNEKTKFNIQQGRTIASDNAWNAALLFIRKKEGIIKGTWGTDAPEYQEFYPHGLDEYNHAAKANKETLLVQYLTAATAHAADLPPTFVADFTALKNDWGAKFTAQQTQIGLVKDANSQTATSRDPLEVQLMMQVLILASKNIGHPEMVNDFFNQSVLQAPQNGETIIETYTAPLMAGMLLNVGPWKNGTKALRFTVTSGKARCSRSLDGTVVDGVPIVLMLPGTETKDADDFQINGMHVVVENLSDSVAANVKVELLG